MQCDNNLNLRDHLQESAIEQYHKKDDITDITGSAVLTGADCQALGLKAYRLFAKTLDSPHVKSPVPISLYSLRRERLVQNKLKIQGLINLMLQEHWVYPPHQRI